MKTKLLRAIRRKYYITYDPKSKLPYMCVYQIAEDYFYTDKYKTFQEALEQKHKYMLSDTPFLFHPESVRQLIRNKKLKKLKRIA